VIVRRTQGKKGGEGGGSKRSGCRLSEVIHLDDSGGGGRGKGEGKEGRQLEDLFFYREGRREGENRGKDSIGSSHLERKEEKKEGSQIGSLFLFSSPI